MLTTPTTKRTEAAIANGIADGIANGVALSLGWLTLGGVVLTLAIARHLPIAETIRNVVTSTTSGEIDLEKKAQPRSSIAGFKTTEGFLPCRNPAQTTKDCRTWEGFARAHWGMDVSTPTGTPLHAPGRVGDRVTVVCSGSVSAKSGYGVLATITVSSLPNYEFRAGHLNDCTSGSYSPGDRIAKTGNSGYSTGPHLHWEERVNGDPVEPAYAWLYQTLTGQLPVTASAGGSDFERSLSFIFEIEGGLSDHPNDRGGRTNMGITRARAADYGLTPDEITKPIATKIYKKDYWDGVCDDLAYPLSMACLNTSVNSGGGKAREFNRKIDPNGDPVSEALTYVDRQTQYYDEIIAADPSQEVFERGWKRRSRDLRARIKREFGR
jgi:murein DD-endopeptidase MepM/ murein hydrolase activator NlpD